MIVLVGVVEISKPLVTVTVGVTVLVGVILGVSVSVGLAVRVVVVDGV